MIISWGRAQKKKLPDLSTKPTMTATDSTLVLLRDTTPIAHSIVLHPSPPLLPLSIAPALFQICTGLWTSVVIVDYEYTKIFIYDTNKSPCGLRNFNPFTYKSGRHTIYFTIDTTRCSERCHCCKLQPLADGRRSPDITVPRSAASCWSPAPRLCSRVTSSKLFRPTADGGRTAGQRPSPTAAAHRCQRSGAG